MSHISKIIIPTRPQSDTIAAIFVLREFGRERFPGIENAQIELVQNVSSEDTFESLLKKGLIPIDIGGFDLDHHGRKPFITCTELVAQMLEVHEKPALSKIIEYVRRDDISGKGTVSDDPIDRAFGLSGLITALNKSNPNNPLMVIESVIPLLKAHYDEELRRTEELPREFETAKTSGKADTFEVRQRDKKLKIVIIKTENMSMPGYLRSKMGGAYDVVVCVRESGHVNILTRPAKRIDLRSLAVVLRLEESAVRGVTVKDDPRYLSQSTKIPEIPMWYYDVATNSIFNGGSNHKDVEPTMIDAITFKKLLEVGLSERLWSPISRR